MTAGKLVPETKQLRKDGISKRAVAKQLGVSRTSANPVVAFQQALGTCSLYTARLIVLFSVSSPNERVHLAEHVCFVRTKNVVTAVINPNHLCSR